MGVTYSDQWLLRERDNERLYQLHNCYRDWHISRRDALLDSWKDKISHFIADRYRAGRGGGRGFGWNDLGISIQNRRHVYGGMGISIVDFTRMCDRISKIAGELDRSSTQPTIVSGNDTHALVQQSLQI